MNRNAGGWATGHPESGGGKRFLLLDDPESAEKAVAELEQWVDGLLVPVYQRHDTRGSWCGQWYEHPDVVAYLHGLYLAWGELVAGGGPLGAVRWHREYLEPVLAYVQHRDGPLSRCSSVNAGDQHTPPDQVYVRWARPMKARPKWLEERFATTHRAPDM
jgi:hypothetical protein